MSDVDFDPLDITLPHAGWLPRDHQVKLWRYLHEGGKRAMAVWHRRAGKDEIGLHHIAISAMQRVGNYWHALPEFTHARRSVWTAVNPHTGKRRIDEIFPEHMRSSCDETAMFLRFVNGSTYQLIGSDQYDRTVGASCAGCVYSEWSLANPSAWAYHRPMIEENSGWALFITTPRGRNHAYEMYKHAMQSSDWFCELLTVVDTGSLSERQMSETRREYAALYGAEAGEAMWQQEYMCDWAAAVLGAFYAGLMSDVRREGRVTPVAPMPGMPLLRAWDLGVADDTSIWWAQPVGGQLLIFDHYSSSNAGVEHYAEVIEQREKERGWTNKASVDLVPHDAKIKEWGSGRTRVETMQMVGLNPMLVPLSSIADGIQAVRRTLPICVFHPRCEDGGIDALEQYRREWDDERKCFKPTALHDWTSHPADAFRYLAMGWKKAPLREIKAPKLEGWHIPPPAEPRRGIQL